MPSRTTALHGFTTEPARLRPVAVASPATLEKVIGAIIKLDGRASRAPGGEDLAYTWEFIRTPLGSQTTRLSSVEADGSVVTFVPDKTGQYEIGLVVSTGYRESAQVTSVVDIQAVLAPYTLRTTPDGAIMLRLMSSFWRLVENKEAFATLWSGYMQGTGSDLLRLFQVDYAKSIADIQSLFQRRWLAYEPALALDHSQCSGVYGHHQSGSRAFTASGSAAGKGVIVSDQEMVLLDGSPSLDAIGHTLRVFTSGGDNEGSYIINRLNPAESGYIVSASTKFPDPADEILSSGETLVTLAGSDEVYSSDVAVDFPALGVVIGDVLQLSSGPDAGLYRISGVGIAGGLTNDRTLRVVTRPHVTLSSRSFKILKSLRIYAVRTPRPTTNTVYIPQSEADLTKYETANLTGIGSVEGAYEVLVESRHVFSALIGQQLKITSGEDGGKGYTITGLNTAGTGYLVGSAFSTAAVSRVVSYEIPKVSDISARVLILDDRAYEIVGASLDETSQSVADGGLGPLWVVTLEQAAAPSGREGMAWRIAAAIETEEFEDLEDLGVVQGDLLILEVMRVDGQQVGELPCHVLGAAGNKVAFDVGTDALVAGTNGSLSSSEILALAAGLRIPRVYEDPEDADEVIISLSAAEIQTLLASRGFATDYYNLPLTSSTAIDLGSYIVQVRPAMIVRNCRIPVDGSLVSVPSLFEYIDEPTFGASSDGDLVLAGRDGEIYSLEAEPVELIENRDYTISSDSSFSGDNLVTTEGSNQLTIPNGDLIDRDVRVGDHIDLTSGLDQGRYVIQEVVDSETVRAVTELGATTNNSATGVSFILAFRTAGNFLRFADGMFTPKAPAPRRLWAQTSLFDNAGYIEDNFGVLVGVTKAQLDRYGSSQISYRGAVRALMYSWAGSKSLRRTAIGCHILVGLPVTEVSGRIVQIDDDYDTENSRGRILIEDLDSEGNGTSLVRVYYYSVAEDESLSEFAGLAVNAETGVEFAVLDVVPAFTPLSRSVLVDDYISDPRWWTVGGATGKDELQKYHTWQVQLDAHEIDSRDMPLIFDFCRGIRPIYTKPKIVLVLYLYDEVTVTDDFNLGISMYLADDPVLSIESTHMVDSYNGSSLANRVLDHGSLGTRTLFEGRDLVTSTGSGTVTSARGGFSGLLDADPLGHADTEAVGLLRGVNDWFEGDVYYRGTPLVRVGDILFIRAGVNRGRYRVTAVVNDTTLTVESLAGWPPRTREAADIEVGTGQVFQIQRQDTEEWASGSASVDAYDAGTGTTTIEDVDGNFRWNGVAVGDVLVVSTGADYGVHEILQVGEIDGFGDNVSLDTKLTVSGQLTEAGTFTYSVRRERLRTNPLFTATDGSTTASSRSITSAATALLLENLEYGDELVPTSGADTNAVFRVVDVVDDNTIVVDRPFTATEVSVTFKVRRPGQFKEGEVPNQDFHLEEFGPLDDVSLAFVEPLSVHLSLADLSMVAGESTATSATDMEAAGVDAGMKLEVAIGHGNTGVFTVVSASTTTVTIQEKWHVTESSVSADFLTFASSWDVENATATLSGTTNLEFGPMMSTTSPETGTTFTNGSATVAGAATTFESTVEVGDVVRLAADDDLAWARVVGVVSDTELTLDRSYAGTGGTGTLQAGVPGGMVREGDSLEIDTLDTYVVQSVAAAVITLTKSTGVSPSASYTGRVIRGA